MCSPTETSILNIVEALITEAWKGRHYLLANLLMDTIKLYAHKNDVSAFSKHLDRCRQFILNEHFRSDAVSDDLQPLPSASMTTEPHSAAETGT